MLNSQPYPVGRIYATAIVLFYSGMTFPINVDWGCILSAIVAACPGPGAAPEGQVSARDGDLAPGHDVRWGQGHGRPRGDPEGLFACIVAVVLGWKEFWDVWHVR